jgi:hypothetical protein
MSNNTIYFPHDCHARNDRKIVNLIMKHGMEGVGIFWCLVEMLYEEGGSMPLEYERITFELRTEINVLRSVIDDFELFISDGSNFSSEAVNSRLSKIQDKSEKARNSVGYRWGKRDNTNVLRTQYEGNTTRNTKKEIKEKKIKVKETKDKGLFILPDFIPREVWSSYMAVRDSKRAAKTSYALTLVINKLVGIEKEYGNKPVDVLNQSITGGWSDVYPLKQGGNGDARAKFTSTNEKRSVLQQDTDREAERINQRWEQAKAASGTLNLSKGNTP